MSSAERKLSTPDFRALFESAPGLYLVLTPDQLIVAASEAYLPAMAQRHVILGRRLFFVLHDNPDRTTATGVRNLKGAPDRAQQNRAPDALAAQKCDLRRPQSEGEKLTRPRVLGDTYART